MKRIAIVGLFALVCTGVTAAESSAQPEYFRCAKTVNASEARLELGCSKSGVNNEYIRVQLGGASLSMTEECAKVKTGEKGTWNGSSCSVMVMGEEEWSKVIKPRNRFTIASGVTTFNILPFIKIRCKKDKGEAEITAGGRIRIRFVKFEECKVIFGSKECNISSPATKELNGELGEVAESEAKDKTGIDFKPVEGKEVMKIEKTECNAASTIEGSVAGEVGPVNELTTSGKITFTPASEKEEKIKKITIEGKSAEPKLTDGGEPVTVEGTEEEKYEEAFEVS